MLQNMTFFHNLLLGTYEVSDCSCWSVLFIVVEHIPRCPSLKPVVGCRQDQDRSKPSPADAREQPSDIQQ